MKKGDGEYMQIHVALFKKEMRASATTQFRKQVMIKVMFLQFEYEPPGDDVTTSSVTPVAAFMPRILTIQNPTKGRMTNWSPIPINKAFRLRNCFRICPMSTVADIPKTKQKRRMWAPISVARLPMVSYFSLVLIDTVSESRLDFSQFQREKVTMALQSNKVVSFKEV